MVMARRQVATGTTGARALPAHHSLGGVAFHRPGCHRPAPGDADGGEAGDREGAGGVQQEVLALVALGRTNSQIAETLFISPKTATVHVSNILGKLGVRNRVEAATVAHRLGSSSRDPDRWYQPPTGRPDARQSEHAVHGNRQREKQQARAADALQHRLGCLLRQRHPLGGRAVAPAG
jgi:DNA-binding CsgD family transcriptional regulator